MGLKYTPRPIHITIGYNRRQLSLPSVTFKFCVSTVAFIISFLLRYKIFGPPNHIQTRIIKHIIIMMKIGDIFTTMY